MKQTTLDNWTQVDEHKTQKTHKTLAERAREDDVLAEILSWEAVEMRDWI